MLETIFHISLPPIKRSLLVRARCKGALLTNGWAPGSNPCLKIYIKLGKLYVKMYKKFDLTGPTLEHRAKLDPDLLEPLLPRPLRSS